MSGSKDENIAVFRKTLTSSEYSSKSNTLCLPQIGAIRIMSSDAQLVVISVPRAKNDLVVGLVGQDDLVGELVGVLTNRYTA